MSFFKGWRVQGPPSPPKAVMFPNWKFDTTQHTVPTYVEYRAVSGVFQNIDPPPPSPPSECVVPPTKGGGGFTLAGRGGGGGSIFDFFLNFPKKYIKQIYVFWKTPDIGLASYSLIPLWPVLYKRLSHLERRALLKKSKGLFSYIFRRLFQKVPLHTVPSTTRPSKWDLNGGGGNVLCTVLYVFYCNVLYNIAVTRKKIAVPTSDRNICSANWFDCSSFALPPRLL